jgi:hypothetical protein
MKPSKNPVLINDDTWFYEYRGRIDLVHWCIDDKGKRRHPSIIKIPWTTLMASAQRCRPEQVKPK